MKRFSRYLAEDVGVTTPAGYGSLRNAERTANKPKPIDSNTSASDTKPGGNLLSSTTNFLKDNPKIVATALAGAVGTTLIGPGMNMIKNFLGVKDKSPYGMGRDQASQDARERRQESRKRVEKSMSSTAPKAPKIGTPVKAVK